MSKLNYNVVRAIGDGNCAFNAFVLGLCQNTTLGRLEHLFTDEPNPITEFYRNVAKVLRVEQGSLANADYFRAIKTKILELRKHDVWSLQKALAPYMRKLACDLAYNESAKADLMDGLQASYFSTKASSGQKKQHADDIFSRFSFILDQFKKLRGMVPPLSEQQEKDALATWWNDEGFNQFAKGMRESGAWAGDVELVALANYFRINLHIRTRNYTGQFHYEHGGLQRDRLTPELIKQLVQRGIIGYPMKGDAFLRFLLKPEDIRARLEAIPDVKQAIAAMPEEGFKTCPIPDFSVESIAALKSRGLITVRDKVNFFSQEKQEVLATVSAISANRAVINDIIECIHDKSPVIVLEHSGVHWNLLTKADEHQPLKYKNSNDADLVAATEKWGKWRDEMKEKYKNSVEQDESERVAYTLDDETILSVTIDEQIAGDEAMARLLQEEEYSKHRKHKP